MGTATSPTADDVGYIKLGLFYKISAIGNINDRMTTIMKGNGMARTTTQCDQCGQADDHPKVHIGEVTKHHDCLSASEKSMVTESSPTAAKIIEACEGGERGSDLLAHIESLHAEG